MKPLPILEWYDGCRRPLPWRDSSDPYRVWVSEIMLQQTTVAAVIPFFERWMERFPSVEALASADEQEVLAAWQGLGYYRRARLLHEGGKRVATDGWPRDAAGWKDLPGVGDYTAGAVCSIALGQPEALVDGNVARVYARLHADRSTGQALLRKAWQWARQAMPRERPGDYNQALMELGATLCTPRQPACGACPCSNLCLARKEGVQEDLPVPEPKKPPVLLAHHVWGAHYEGRWGFRQIPSGEWWHGLWEMPRSEDPAALASWLGSGEVEPAGSFCHTVTRHRITVLAGWLELSFRPDGLEFFDEEEVEKLPLPAPQRKAWGLVKKARRESTLWRPSPEPPSR